MLGAKKYWRKTRAAAVALQIASWRLFINVLSVIWIFTLFWGQRSASHLWERLDRPHCTNTIVQILCPSEIRFTQKPGNMVCLEQRNPDAKQGQQLQRCSCSVPLRLWEGEEVGRVARIQPPTKLVVAQFRIHLATPWTFLSTFWGLFEDLWCNVASDLLLPPVPD